MKDLQVLDLSYNGIGPEGVKNNRQFRGSVSSTQTERELAARERRSRNCEIWRGRCLPGLVELEVGMNYLHDEGAVLFPGGSRTSRSCL